jgi:hypothetical protein
LLLLGAKHISVREVHDGARIGSLSFSASVVAGMQVRPY